MKTTTDQKSFKDLVFFIWKFLANQPWSFFVIFFISLAWSIDSTVWPYLLRLIIDTLTEYDADRTAAWGALKWLAIAAVCLWVSVECLFRSRDFIRSYAFPKLEADIRMAMFDHVQHHSPNYFNEHFAGSLSNKISDMTTQVSSMLQNIMVFIPALGSSILILFFFSEVSPIFAIILGVWIAVHFSICFFFASKCVKYANDSSEACSTLVGKIVDSFTNNFAVNLFSRFQHENSRIGSYQKIELAKNRKAQFYVALMMASLSVTFLVGIITLNWVLIHYWIQNKITTGEVIQVLTPPST